MEGPEGGKGGRGVKKKVSAFFGFFLKPPFSCLNSQTHMWWGGGGLPMSEHKIENRVSSEGHAHSKRGSW